MGIFNSTATGSPQNHNPGLAKNSDGSLYTDAQGWAYAFLTVGLERPDVTTWAVGQGRFRPRFTLSVGKLGSGTGEVSSNPSGIQCGTNCSKDYAAPSQVSLVATPAIGSVFAGWSGDPDCTDGVVTLTSSRSCFATFYSAVNAHIIWIQPQPLAGFGPPGSLVLAGSASGAAAGTTVQLAWRNATQGGTWVTEPYRPLSDSNGIWYHAIPNANFLERYDAYINYGGISSATCTYQGNNQITWCP